MSSDWRTIFLQVLRDDLAERRKKNHRYSLRQYARKLELSPGNLSDFLSGKRPITRERALALLEKLSPAPKLRNRLAALLGAPLPVDFAELPAGREHRAPDWKNLAIVGLCELDLPRMDEAELGARLALPVEEVRGRVEMLLAEGVLKRDANGGLHHEPRNVSLLGHFTPEERRRLRCEATEVALRALSTMPEEKALSRNMVFTGSRETMELFQNEINRLFNALNGISGTQSRDELFQVSVQLFPYNFRD